MDKITLKRVKSYHQNLHPQRCLFCYFYHSDECGLDGVDNRFFTCLEDGIYYHWVEVKEGE